MKISEAGKLAVNELARKYGFSPEAVESMLISVVLGNASMAQFQHPEFGGSGQWMRGGMTMVSDMFNNTLKARVDSLCGDLSALVSGQADVIIKGSGGASTGPSGWWGQDFGQPCSSGGQNNVRYAWFSAARRLAVEESGQITVYDTLDHQIVGFSQQQSHGSSMSFTSQHGSVDLRKLPVVSGSRAEPAVSGPRADQDPSAVVPVTWSSQSQSQSADRAAAPRSQDARPPASAAADPAATPGARPVAVAPTESGLDVFTLLEKLAELHKKGILTDEEFSTKKADLLGRL
jgi:hypothetical protein